MTTVPAETHAPVSLDVDSIRWPDGFRPGESAVHIHNELVIPAPLSAVWQALIRAGKWPEWYPNVGDIHFVSHAGPVLRERSRIRWNTYGFRIASQVLEFEPETRLAWNVQGLGVSGYHAWLLTPLDAHTTRVVTEETENGWLASLSKLLAPRRVEKKHQLWLEALSQEARKYRH
jgi:uncharacterized protein YndB with AHSA1/START domain